MLRTYKNNGYRILSNYDDTHMKNFVEQVPEQLPEQLPEKQVTYECSNGQCNNSNKKYNLDPDNHSDLCQDVHKSNGYRKLCKYDSQTNTCSEPVQSRQTYECLNGQCQTSNKKYDPSNNVYNSVYECRAFCHPAIPNEDSSFENVHKSNGYRKLCKYDSQTNTCSEPVQSRQTYECLNGQCQTSNKKYDPSNNVYNSVYECRAFCHPAIPNEDSSFENVHKSNGYRKLCKYDSQTNTCNQLHPDGLTYECLNGQCNISTKEYDPYNSVYDNIDECRTYCQSTIPDEVSYKCIQSDSNNLCTQINEYPDVNNNRYPTLQECTSHCSYENPLSYSCSSGCHPVYMPSDGITSFVTADECTSVCGNESDNESGNESDNESGNESDPVYYKNRICMSKIPLTYNFSLKPSLACDTGEFY